MGGVDYGLTSSGRQNWPVTITVPVGTEVTITMSQSGGGSGAWLNGTRVLLVPMLYYDTPYTYTFTTTGTVSVSFEESDGGGGGIFTITMGTETPPASDMPEYTYTGEHPGRRRKRQLADQVPVQR